MKVRSKNSGRKRVLFGLSGSMMAFAIGGLIVVTEMAPGLNPVSQGVALAKLIARSPGVRVGGVALKAKRPRAAVAPVADEAIPPPMATVMGAEAPGETPSGSVPSDVFPPDLFPDTQSSGVTPSGTDESSHFVFSPPTPIQGGGGGGILTGGGGTPGGTPTPVPTPPTPNVPISGPVPEPSTWLMLILGFGMIGAQMRRSRWNAARI